ncbi:hypothetical protein D3C80_732550 [compost metagenome]
MLWLPGSAFPGSMFRESNDESRPVPSHRCGDQRSEGVRSALRDPRRAAAVQQPPGDRGHLPVHHPGAGLPGARAVAQRGIREDDPHRPSVHRQLPGEPQAVGRYGQYPAYRRRGERGHHLRRRVPRHRAQAQRRGVPAARRRPPVHEVAVGARSALDRRHRGWPGRRPGDPRRLRRLGAEPRTGAHQRRAFRRDRPVGGGELPLQHRAGAAAGAHR